MKTLTLALTLFSFNAFAWGPTGHRVVGEVAQKFLTTEAMVNAHKILGRQSFSRVSTWADEIKSEPETYSHTFNWHYTDWADDAHDHDESASSGKMLLAIREQIAVLKDASAPQDKKAFALKFIIHLIGDVHMPLHVGNGVDRGGNNCKVLFHGEEMNLHSLWDEGMINFTRLSFTELANYVSQGRTIEEIKRWRTGDFMDWALESKKLRSEIYPEDVVKSATPISGKQYCRRDITVTTDQMPKLSYQYSYKFVPVMEQRLFQAGLRLAVLLNEVLK